MPPDLNSLPPSPSPTSPFQHTSSQQPRNMSQSPSSPPASHTPPHSHSLAAAATMNAGIHNEDLRRQSSGSMRREVERARRRSSIRMNLNINDPSLPAPGELAMSPSSRSRSGQWPHSPHHERTPSLGELHQELEYEQEGQVNRLLSMIRQQQSQIQQLQATHPQTTSAVDDDATTPTSERSMSLQHTSSNHNNPPPPHHPPQTISPVPYNSHPRAPPSRQSSRASRSQANSHTNSPALHPSSGQSPYDTSAHEYLPGPAVPTRDESLFYQAETQMLTRENQMLKLRIRELERQLADMSPGSAVAAVAHSPTTTSGLHNSMLMDSRSHTPANGEADGARAAVGSEAT